ncbi:hypothetical protein CYMTET_50002 [Cymbomonas tetramitiformis]|uniref:Uncharacterized protein n=1 Tax=Cymbomonas tetramitiformis TaxID=36881 RepID=A0AAE0BP06_9CHLO|nr:hypothetical protein CYMTET_50002 [Cymbomonas tetramitiformis]
MFATPIVAMSDGRMRQAFWAVGGKEDASEFWLLGSSREPAVVQFFVFGERNACIPAYCASFYNYSAC